MAREVVYGSLGVARRVALHQRLAEVLEPARGGGGDCSRAVHYAREAARRALQQCDWNRVLELVGGSGGIST